MLSIYKQITIETLKEQGVRNSEIARQIGCHRNTVTNVIQREGVIEKQTRIKPSKYTPHKKKIKELLDQKISHRRIYEILEEEYALEKSYSSLNKYIQKHFPKPVTAYGVQVTEAGEEAEVDFGYLGMLPNKEGKKVKTCGFSMILSYSRLGYYAITYDQKIETLCQQLQLAVEYFQGTPKRLKVDNMKTAILKNNHYELEFNQEFLEFVSHYNMVIVPCTPYHPEQKGKVESSIKYLQNNFVSGRNFENGQDLNAQLTNWRDNYANKRIHGTTRKVPFDEFLSTEKKTLQTLPTEQFAFFSRGVRKVATNCHIHFENNYYSVPALFVGKEVIVRWNEYVLRVIYAGEVVAVHVIEKSTGVYVSTRSHLPDYKSYSQTEFQARWEKKMETIGNYALQYFNQLLLSRKNYWNRIARGIMKLAQEYGNEAVNLSLKRALYYNVKDLITIRNIVENKLYKKEAEPKLLSNKKNSASLSRDLNYYQII